MCIKTQHVKDIEYKNVNVLVFMTKLLITLKHDVM